MPAAHHFARCTLPAPWRTTPARGLRAMQVSRHPHTMTSPCTHGCNRARTRRASRAAALAPSRHRVRAQPTLLRVIERASSLHLPQSLASPGTSTLRGILEWMKLRDKDGTMRRNLSADRRGCGVPFVSMSNVAVKAVQKKRAEQDGGRDAEEHEALRGKYRVRVDQFVE
ncbi:hypothetical protein C8R44DRAFT_751152 [Mycena epipterygia]|nr:hypothetical protein C8R44DRAFT_751152 [Mycena epipterygia]